VRWQSELQIASPIEYQSGNIVHVTTQIAVRLPDDLVTYVDQLVRDGAGSRATVLTRALTMYRQHVTAERDAQILREQGDYDDFDGLTSFGKIDVD
jgi:Arc/MetJ-type ribon-helix-helix transcriptional regulator